MTEMRQLGSKVCYFRITIIQSRGEDLLFAQSGGALVLEQSFDLSLPYDPLTDCLNEQH